MTSIQSLDEDREHAIVTIKTWGNVRFADVGDINAAHMRRSPQRLLTGGAPPITPQGLRRSDHLPDNADSFTLCCVPVAAVAHPLWALTAAFPPRSAIGVASRVPGDIVDPGRSWPWGAVVAGRARQDRQVAVAQKCLGGNSLAPCWCCWHCHFNDRWDCIPRHRWEIILVLKIELNRINHLKRYSG